MPGGSGGGAPAGEDRNRYGDRTYEFRARARKLAIEAGGDAGCGGLWSRPGRPLGVGGGRRNPRLDGGGGRRGECPCREPALVAAIGATQNHPTSMGGAAVWEPLGRRAGCGLGGTARRR